jgi:hypothetical protein
MRKLKFLTELTYLKKFDLTEIIPMCFKLAITTLATLKYSCVYEDSFTNQEQLNTKLCFGSPVLYVTPYPWHAMYAESNNLHLYLCLRLHLNFYLIYW